MGKPFINELKHLPSSLKWGGEVGISLLAKFVAWTKGNPLITVGAGGSFTVAEFTRLLHEERGGIGLSHTPLSFIQSKTNIRDSYVVIFTASGNNRDVLATYDAAVQREPQGILIVCGKKQSKVEVKARASERTTIFAHAFPAGRDGYLATNSLVVFSILMLRAFGHPTPTVELVTNLSERAQQRWKETTLLPTGASYYLALFGGWGRPAAIDFESKFSEAGLGGVMLTDYRHFAHGRHNWIDKRGEQSIIIAFFTPDSSDLAKRTLALLPPSTRIIKFETHDSGPIGALELLLDVFQFTLYVGQKVGIDPGRPRVPSYGGKIYHLGPMLSNKRSPRAAALSAINRKLVARGTLGNQTDEIALSKARNAYIEKLAGTRFGALVTDFDGTVVSPGAGPNGGLSEPVTAFFEKLLRAGVQLYFATGRGDSIYAIVAASINRRYHSQIFISYYNGSVTAPLTKAPPKSQDGPYHAEFEKMLKRLRREPLLANVTNLENKNFQITAKASTQLEFSAISIIIRELIAQESNDKYKVVQSSHSLDIIPLSASKMTCVKLAKDRLAHEFDVLTIGDRGALFGNDYELLAHPFSLSVDSVSTDMHSCWNLLPPGCRNVAGLVHYSRSVACKANSFTLTLPV